MYHGLFNKNIYQYKPESKWATLIQLKNLTINIQNVTKFLKEIIM